MLSEVLTGFGAIPRRGAEVGGILLGRADAGTLWVDEVVMTPCEHRRGPSFLLSESDTEKFDEAFANAAEAEAPARPVGIFRSNTRDKDEITDEDRALYSTYFPNGDGVFLLVRPFATRPPVGAFALGEEGTLPPSPGEVFEFNRGENTLPAPVPARRRAAPEHTARPAVIQPEARAPQTVPAVQDSAVEPPAEIPAYHTDADDAGSYAYPGAAEVRTRRRGWLWIPVSFILLVGGVLLGFQSALTFYPRPGKVDASVLGIGLSVVRRGDNLHISWNREALAIRNAQRGTLVIEDGGYKKAVDLDASALQNGSVIYPPTSENVNLRLEVALTSGTQISEARGWSKQKE
jgi:hypothetical protein